MAWLNPIIHYILDDNIHEIINGYQVYHVSHNNSGTYLPLRSLGGVIAFRVTVYVLKSMTFAVDRTYRYIYLVTGYPLRLLFENNNHLSPIESTPYTVAGRPGLIYFFLL